VLDSLDIITKSATVLHELGHYYTVNYNLSQFENYEVETVFVINNKYEKAAELFRKYIYKKEMGLVIYKPYIKYINNPDVFEYKTGRKIEFSEAVENNIWNDIQELPLLRKIITQDQEAFFDNLIN